MSIAEKLITIAENEHKVYEAGKQAERDVFWGGLQNSGTRNNYSRTFFQAAKLDDWFYPKYDFNISSSAAEMFRGATCSTGFDLVQRLDDCGVTMNFTGCSNFQLAFAWLPVKSLPIINVSGIKNESGIDQAFAGCSALVNLSFAGTLSVKSLNLQWSKKLSKASIESIIGVLSPTTSGLSITLSKTAVDNAFPPIIDGEEIYDNVDWLSLINDKDNWTINLV